MKTALLTALFLAVAFCKAGESYIVKNNPDSVISYYASKVNPDSIQFYMQTLENFGTRFCLADNRKQIAEWIRDKFIAFGYQNAYLDSFQFNRTYAGTLYQTWQYNVIAPYEGYKNPDSIFVLGAHHDAIVPFSSNPFLNAPGADDNASGVAATLEIARVMKHYGYQPAYTIKFMTFAAEELGLHGSWNYANKAANAGENIICMINNDMVSYCTLPEENWKVRIQKYANSDWFTNLAHQIIQNHTILTAVESTQYIQYSDSWPFYQKGYKAIFFIEDQFTPFYHTINDLVATTNKHYAAEMTKISLGMLVFLNGLGAPTLLVPENLVVQDTLISSGQQACFAATKSIVVCNEVIVEDGAWVDLVAGENILFLPGTVVHSGGRLHARITTDSIFCNPEPMLASTRVGSEPDDESEIRPKRNSTITLYPNPTTGIITLNLADLAGLTDVSVQILNLSGEILKHEMLPAKTQLQMDMTSYDPGFYFVVVIAGEIVKPIKVVKL